jgi:hypothetical protein
MSQRSILGPKPALREEAGMSPARETAWVVAARLADGRRLYHSPKSGRQGQQEWSPRTSQAHRYATRDDAERAAIGFATNSDALEYEVIQCP